jgi:hypothetical protein
MVPISEAAKRTMTDYQGLQQDNARKLSTISTTT